MTAQGLAAGRGTQRCWLRRLERAGGEEPERPRGTQAAYAHEHPPVGSLLGAVEALRPTALIGVAAVGGTFTEPVLRGDGGDQPAADRLRAVESDVEVGVHRRAGLSLVTDGRALFACGSPFDPVTLDGRTYVPRQGNNSYIFPGVGLGAIACGAKRVIDEMFLAAADALAATVTQADLDQGSLYPPLANVREVSARIAAAVARIAYRRGLATKPEPADLLGFVRSHVYDPHYRSYV